MNRLAILLSVTAAISRENNLDRILSLAADHIIEADGIDGVLIYLKSQVKNEIELKQYRGISPETASTPRTRCTAHNLSSHDFRAERVPCRPSRQVGGTR